MKEKKPRKPKPSANVKTVDIRWILLLFCASILISIVVMLISDRLLAGASFLVSFCILFFIIAIGILFDMLGIATATCDEKPLHSMAARKRYGSVEALRLLRNTEKVSSFCNDVVGDICSIISGGTTAAIVVLLTLQLGTESMWLSVGLTGLVAAITVSGKAIGKVFALNHNAEIVVAMGKLIRFCSLKK